jgi:hypothetical protein
VKRRFIATVLSLALAAGAMLAPLASIALPRDSEAGSPQQPELAVPEAPALELAAPTQVPKLSVAVVLTTAVASAPPCAPQLAELRPGEHRTADDQLRWYLGHGTTSSLH